MCDRFDVNSFLVYCMVTIPDNSEDGPRNTSEDPNNVTFMVYVVGRDEYAAVF